MAILAFAPPDYRNWVMMSESKRLLVEGPADKRLFKLLLDSLQVPQSALDIDTAESLIEFGSSSGNRTKVEVIAQSIASLPCASRFAGFVDREDRSFSHTDPIADLLSRHQVVGRLVWSRGHSVENYYFDFRVLREPLRTFSVTDHFDNALTAFEQVLRPALSIACSLGLAARDEELQSAVRGSLAWPQFSVRPEGLAFDHAKWNAELVLRLRLTSQAAGRLTAAYQTWAPIVARSDQEVIRWMCDGHLGLAAIWAVYGACVAHACSLAGCADISREVSKVLMASESVRFNACADSWARRALGNQVSFPVEVFHLLDLRAPSIPARAA